MITRRMFNATSLAALAALGTRRASAQFTEQEVSNGLQVVSTGNVTVDQAASGQQSVDIFGRPVEDGIYRTTTGQVVVNDGQIVATGDVNVSQAASGQQTVFTAQQGGRRSYCDPGDWRWVDRCTVEFCDIECEWVSFTCPDCRTRCKGRC